MADNFAQSPLFFVTLVFFLNYVKRVLYMFKIVTFAFILTIFVFSSHGKLKVKGQEDISKWRLDIINPSEKDVYENGAILQLELVATRAYNGNMLPLRSFN